MLEQDEHADLDRSEDLAKPKFTLTECIIAIVFSIVLTTLLAYFLVERIEDVVESGVPDQFLGLILLPLVEKAAEHLTAIDEAWDGQMVCLTPETKHYSALIFGEFCPLPLHRPIDPDRSLQCSARSNCGLDRWQADGFEFRDFHDCSSRAVDSSCRKLSPRR